MSIPLERQAPSEAGIFGLLRRQATVPKYLPAGTDLTDQTAVVTGSNVGLGLEASRQLLQLGLSHLIMGVRSPGRGEKAAQQLRQEYPSAIVSVWLLNMESTVSVRAFARYCATLSQLDFVILNAGGMPPAYATVAETGYEVTIQVNYLSTVLLSILLLPILRLQTKNPRRPTTRPPVLSVVGSDIMYTTDFKMTDGSVLPKMNDPAKFSQPRWYGTSKLLLMMSIWKLAERVKPEEVLINVVNPGMTAGTAFFDKQSFINRMKMRCIWRIVGVRQLDTAATIYVDALVARGAESHGSFLSDWAIKPYPADFYSEDGRAFGERLWDETIEVIGPLGVTRILKDLRGDPAPLDRVVGSAQFFAHSGQGRSVFPSSEEWCV